MVQDGLKYFRYWIWSLFVIYRLTFCNLGTLTGLYIISIRYVVIGIIGKYKITNEKLADFFKWKTFWPSLLRGFRCKHRTEISRWLPWTVQDFPHLNERYQNWNRSILRFHHSINMIRIYFLLLTVVHTSWSIANLQTFLPVGFSSISPFINRHVWSILMQATAPSFPRIFSTRATWRINRGNSSRGISSTLFSLSPIWKRVHKNWAIVIYKQNECDDQPVEISPINVTAIRRKWEGKWSDDLRLKWLDFFSQPRSFPTIARSKRYQLKFNGKKKVY